MSKIVIVDGNNLMFRSFYATMGSDGFLRNKDGKPTNALFGFTNMINKILDEEKPTHMVVAFDKGKNFRKEKYDFYKEGRDKIPNELIYQMEYSKVLLDALGIKHIDFEPYEADDIIGTVVKLTEEDDNFDALIISSDKDLLQLISNNTEMKLLKQSGYIKYNRESFIKEYNIEPINVIDLKAIMGDSSDNIPGVKGIGEKGALKLLSEYKTLENVYNNIDNISGKTKEKLLNDKDNAFMSKEIATIYRDIDLNISLNDLKYNGINKNKLIEVYEYLNFNSLLKKIKDTKEYKVNYKYIDNIDNLNLDSLVALHIEIDNDNYNNANIIGISISDKNNNYIIDNKLLNKLEYILKDKEVLTYDYKKILHYININSNYDLMIAAFLLNNNVKYDMAYLLNNKGIDSLYIEELNNIDIINNNLVIKSKYILDTYNNYINELNILSLLNIFNNIEMPLIKVLSSMEKSGIKVDRDILNKMKIDILNKMDDVSKEIYKLTGEVFNINSPKQLGEVLFDKLLLEDSKKNKIGYKTDINVLKKLIDKHPSIIKIIEYRNLSKLYSTYIEGFNEYINNDNILHTVYNQILTRTGRLSSSHPNMQNIPTREEYGKEIKYAFIPKYDYLVSVDYSQIELRVLAHLANSKELIDAFNNDEDIHKKVASDIYGVNIEDVTSNMRRSAKAVVFGIVYGISGFGLGENLNISKKDADMYINKYLEMYPSIKEYMDLSINKAKELGYVKNLFGRVRYIDEIKNSNFLVRKMGERMALNTPVQSTSADIMKIAMINIYNSLKNNNLKSELILQIHDEVVLDVYENELDKVIEIIKYEMENAYKLNVVLKTNITYGKNLYELK